MLDHVLALGQRNLRGTDSNSLLRLYDRARAISKQSPSLLERAKANKAIQRIGRELRNRNVPV